jgi:hypothetical protein
MRIGMPVNFSPEVLLSEHFGPFAVPAWRLLHSIEAATKNQTYSFMDMNTYNTLTRDQPEEAPAIYWREMLLRLHLTCCISLRRHGEWLNALLARISHASLS